MDKFIEISLPSGAEIIVNMKDIFLYTRKETNLKPYSPRFIVVVKHSNKDFSVSEAEYTRIKSLFLAQTPP